MELIKNYTILDSLYKQSGLYDALHKAGWDITNSIFPHATYNGPTADATEIVEFIFKTSLPSSPLAQTPLNSTSVQLNILSIYIEYAPNSTAYLNTFKDEMHLNNIPDPGDNPDVYRARGLFLAFKFAASFLNKLKKYNIYQKSLWPSYNYVSIIDHTGRHRNFRIEFTFK